MVRLIMNRSTNLPEQNLQPCFFMCFILLFCVFIYNLLYEVQLNDPCLLICVDRDKQNQIRKCKVSGGQVNLTNVRHKIRKGYRRVHNSQLNMTTPKTRLDGRSTHRYRQVIFRYGTKFVL